MVKKEIFPLKTGKNISEKLLFVLLIHLTVLQLHLQRPFAKTVLVEFAKSYLEANRSLFWKRNYPKIETENKHSEKLLCVLSIQLKELQLSPQEAFR